jgi:glycerate 2-kinase
VAAAPRLPDAIAASAPQRVSFIEGGHPEPTAGSLTAGRAVEALLSQVTARDLVIVLVSGGGSALMELPRAGISLADLKRTTALLLKSGAAIKDFNAVRAQLSQLKGGGLARLASPARVLGLILSDVVDSPLAAIASGPTVLGAAESAAALTVVERYGLRAKLPASVVQALQHGTGPLAGDPPRVENRLIGSNRVAAEAAVVAAHRLGFEAELIGDDWQGEARLVGRRFARQLIAATRLPANPSRAPRFEPGPPPRCLVAGGESTVTVRGQGRGGRNQEAALAAALVIDGQPRLAISTFATDGVDGPTDAAGAVVTGETLTRARALGLDAEHYLNDNDSYAFFARTGGLVITGPTGTNVDDLMFGLAY